MNKSTCTMPECEREHVAKGLCRTHYKAQRRADGHPGELMIYKIDAQCIECGQGITKDKRTVEAICRPCKTERTKKRAEANRERSRQAQRNSPPKPSISCKVSFIACHECGAIFSARKSSAKHCSSACSYAAGKDERLAVLRAKYVRREPTEQACTQCSETFMASHGARYCGPCAESNRAEARRDYSHRRRATLKGADQERISSRLVYERDAWMCGICSEPVNKAHEYPHLMSASLDHVVPLAKGGTHTMQNVQLAHFMCNSKKGDRAGSVKSLTA